VTLCGSLCIEKPTASSSPERLLVMSNHDSDVRAISDIIDHQFTSMSWQTGGEPDRAVFKSDFYPEASLFASVRPLKALSLGDFLERMNGLVGTALRSFDERVLGSRIVVFGNVAMAAVACKNMENGADITRNVEMMLLAKEQGNWKIVAQAWDKATETKPVPDELLRHH
jgi:Putative lumazine-binding